MKVRIFALAKELDMDSKELIQHCNDAGIAVKNSALASITPDERDVVLGYLKERPAESEPAAAEPAPVVPRREPPPADRFGKVRQIRSARPARGEAPVPEDEEEPEAPQPVAEAKEQPEAEPGEVAQEAVGKGDQAESAQATDQDSDAEAVATEEEGGEDEDKPEGISRQDYVGPGGGGVSGIREMKPRASIRESGRRKEKQKKPSLPNMAPLPNFKPPTPAASAANKTPAQKPDLALTPDMLKKNSPLADHLKKHAENRRRTPGEGEETARRRPRTGAAGLEEARQQRRSKRRRSRPSEDDENRIRRTQRRSRRSSGPIQHKTQAEIEVPITVRALSEELGRPAKDLLSILFQQGEMLTINDVLDEEAALEIGLELGVELTLKRARDLEAELEDRLEAETPDGSEIEPRPPVITVLGHVDHGKTTLVDRLRSSNVAAGEAGGITQHIAAYQVDHDGQAITFVDTPGHAAFGEMRARGANVTDIVVLVVAGDDGVMPQTQECISHAKAAGVPLIVAMNKMDLPDVNEQKVLTELSQYDVLPSEWGGDTEVVRISALEGSGIDDLLETILLTAELHEYTAPVDVPAMGVCLEAFRDEGRGPVAWMIVREGMLHVGDIVLCGGAHGRVRAMYNDKDEVIDAAGPSTPVRIAGLDTVPGAGDRFFVLDSLDQARQIVEQRVDRGRSQVLGQRGGPRTLEEILAGGPEGEVRELPLILKADTPGSIEALRSEIEKFEHPEVKVRILHEGVGGVNESDVYLASSSGAIIVAFHVVAEDRAEALASTEGVEIRRYNIIYEVTDHIRLALEGMLRPERVEVATGRALVLQTFSISRFGTIAGCRVLNGTIDRNNRMHVIRDQKVLNDYPIGSLRREKDDVKEVREGMECGIRLDGFNDVKEGDLLESFRIEEVKRSLQDR